MLWGNMRTRREYRRRGEYKRKRSALLQEHFVEPVSYKKLFERDHGICQICGLPIVSNSEKDLWGGTRDHIIPLSRGGEHSYANCQLAHRICNSLKLDGENCRIDWESMAEKSKKYEKYYRNYQETVKKMTPGEVKSPGETPS